MSRKSKDRCLEITDSKLPIRVEIIKRTKPSINPPPSRIPIWIGRKPKCPKTVSQHQGPNDCLRNSFHSTPTLESDFKHSIRSYLRSTPNLEKIDERKPLTVKPRKGTCGRCPKPCPPKPTKQNIRQLSKLQDSDSNYLQSELGSTFLFPKTHTKLSPFCSTPCLGVKNSKCAPLRKLLVSKMEKPKSGKPNHFKSKSLIDRSSLSQKEYMDLLSTPRPKVPKPQPVSNSNLCRKFDSCSPRIAQIAAPSKRLVLANWKSYQNVYSAEQLERFQRILNSEGNDLEVPNARAYFDSLDHKKAKPKKKCKCKDNSNARKWLDCQIGETVDTIVQHFETEPLFMLNFKEMIMSDEILNWLERKKVIKIANRSTRNVYKRTVIDICDKVVTWMDKLNYVVDLQALDSKEELTFLAKFSSESFTSEEEEFDRESGKELVPLFSPSFEGGFEESGESESEENIKYESSFEREESVKDESSDEYFYDDAVETLY